MTEPGMSALLRIGPLELAVVTVLWDTGQPMTVREIQDQMSYPERLAYTTVATVLSNLFFKGHVTRRKERRRFYYQAGRRREEYLAACIRALLAEAPDPAEVLALALGAHLPDPAPPADGRDTPAGLPGKPAGDLSGSAARALRHTGGLAAGGHPWRG